MLSWKVCWHRDPCPGDCECVRHRKRRPRRDHGHRTHRGGRGCAVVLSSALDIRRHGVRRIAGAWRDMAVYLTGLFNRLYRTGGLVARK